MPRQLDKRIKGCNNPMCECKYNKTKYKFDDQFCVKCGSNLVYVCSNCLKPFDSNSPTETLCADCLAVIEKRRAERQEVLRKARGTLNAAVMVVPVAIKKAPAAIKVATNVIENPRAREVLKRVGAKAASIAKIVK